MKYLSIFSGIFLLLVFFFSWGFFSGTCDIFPGPKIKQISNEVVAFVQGGEANKKTVLEKLSNDIGIRPDRILVRTKQNSNRDYQPLEIEGLKKRRKRPLVFFDGKDAIPPGYLFIWGAFDFERHLHGGILIDENGKVIHTWVPDEEAFISEISCYNEKMSEKGTHIVYSEPEGRFPHGLLIFPDGSLIFNDGDAGNGMQKIDFCSNVLWIKLGNFNHILSKDNDGSSIWTMDGDNRFHEIDAINGESLRIINVEDIMVSNADCDILSIRRNYLTGDWLDDRWHFNDIEPMPAEYKNAFPQFNPGDLLLSMRSLNAIMVVDPNSKKIKWWRVGAFSRQHDPDWQKNGCITVYDNQMRDENGIGNSSARFSRIVSIDTNSYEAQILYDGSIDDFYSNIRGKHQILPNGNILITSPMQGRVFIVNNEWQTTFDFLNRYDNNTLMISEAIWLPQDFFNFEIRKKAAGNKSESKWHAGKNISLHYSASRIEKKQALSILQPVPFNSKLSFKNSPFLVFEGWSKPEKAFRWSEGNITFLYFVLPEGMPKQEILVQMLIHTLGRQEIRTFCNGQLLETFDVEAKYPENISFYIPPSAIMPSEVNTLKFEFPGARSPDSPDPRILAVALYEIQFHHD